MVIKIDTEIPYFWLQDARFRLGFDKQITKMLQLQGKEAQLLAEFFHGVSEDGAKMFAKEYDVSEERLETILRTIEPALIRTPSNKRYENPGISINYSGIEEIGHKIQQYYGGTYFQNPRSAAVRTIENVTILAGRYVNLPHQSQHLLSDDTILLPVVFGDQSVRVGPIILPGISPCVFCHYLTIQRRDPDTATMVSTRFTQPTTTEQTHQFFTAIGAISPILETLEQRVQQKEFRSQQFFNDGRIIERDWHIEPECGCLWQQARTGTRPTASAAHAALMTSAGPFATTAQSAATAQSPVTARPATTV